MLAYRLRDLFSRQVVFKMMWERHKEELLDLRIHFS